MDTVDSVQFLLLAASLAIGLWSAYRNYRREQLEERKHEEDQVEKARRCFEVSIIDEPIKKEVPPHEPCRIWAVRLLAANRSDEQVLLKDVSVELGFRRLNPSTKQLLLELVQRSIWPAISLNFRFTETGIGSCASGDAMALQRYASDESIQTSTRLVNWENRTLIHLTEDHWHRGPAPGEKQIWMLFGELPAEFATKLLQAGLYLATVKCRFHTDREVTAVSGSYPEAQNVSDAFVERLRQLSVSSSGKNTTDESS